MSLTVLQVAYPLAPVSRDAVGGAEQIVSMLDRAVVASSQSLSGGGVLRFSRRWDPAF